jgi:hypothetical protein
VFLPKDRNTGPPTLKCGFVAGDANMLLARQGYEANLKILKVKIELEKLVLDSLA